MHQRSIAVFDVDARHRKFDLTKPLTPLWLRKATGSCFIRPLCRRFEFLVKGLDALGVRSRSMSG